MDKIPTIFVRDPENMKLVTREITPGCEWVFAGEGVPTVKKDGTNIKVAVGTDRMMGLTQAWKRRNPTREEKAAGAEPGYVVLARDDPENKHIWAAVLVTDYRDWPDGEWPCEALGPKIQGGIESDVPCLYPFSWKPTFLSPLEVGNSFDSIQEFLRGCSIEGIVWHHPDGRMAKVKRRDFNIPWPPRQKES